jgi:hypothetical protein
MSGTRLVAVLLVTAVGAGCATGGGYPSAVGDARTNMTRAQELIDDAAKAGADSLAPDAMKSARAHFAEADAADKSKAKDHAAMAARQAAADATYARAVAQRVIAERTRAAEQAQLQSLAPSPASTSTGSNP